jgi:hypothetical protein
MVVKINQEHLRKILMKNWRISISSSTLKINGCLICNVSVAVGKICNERHCMSPHKDHIRKQSRTPAKDAETRHFERNLRSRQAIFCEPTDNPKAANTAAYKITEILAQKTAFYDGNMKNVTLTS